MQTRWQVNRFLVVGGLTVLIDLCVYRLLAWLGMDVDVAKAAGFLTGTVFAYIANRHFTFQAEGGLAVVARFCLLYATTLGLNVLVNAGCLRLLPPGETAVAAAFFVATGLSAVTNFLGMKFFVFPSHRRADRPT